MRNLNILIKSALKSSFS